MPEQGVPEGAEAAEQEQDDDDPEPPGGGGRGDSVEAARAARRDAAQAWLAPLKERLREARARGASLAEIAKEAREWRPDTVALAADMEQNVQRGLMGGVDAVKAANPYGCNQYGEGWAEAHEGKSTRYEQTGFSGKQSKMLTHQQDGNTVSVATKQKKPGKGAYPDASEKGLEKAAEKSLTAEEKAVHDAKHMMQILEQSAKIFTQYKNEKALAQVRHMQSMLENMAKLLEDGKVAPEKGVQALKNATKTAGEELEKMLANPRPEKSPEQLTAEIKAKSAELTKALEDEINEANSAMAEFEAAKANGSAYLAKMTILQLKHWAYQLEHLQKEEITKDSLTQLGEYAETIKKEIAKAKQKIALMKEELSKKPKPAEKPQEKPQPKSAAKGAKAALLAMPDAESAEVKKLVAEAESTGERSIDKVWGTLTDKERSIVYEYTGNLYKPINKSFRAGQPTEEAKILQKVLNKMETGMDLTVTRCEGTSGLEGILPAVQRGYLNSNMGRKKLAEWINAQIAAGGEFVRPNKAPMSTSLARGAFGKKPVVRIITMPKGTKGGCIANHSKFKFESEFLIAPGTKTRIIGAEVDENGTIFIREEVIK